MTTSRILVLFTTIIVQMFLCSFGHAQSWFDVETDIFHEGPTFSGSPLAVVDMNGDFLDDIVFLDRGIYLYIGYQNPEGEKMRKQYVGITNKDPQWCMVVFDVDRNGFRDIVISGAYDDLKVYYQFQDTFQVERISIPTIYSQGMNAVDINNDGWTDIFLCNDIGYNVVWWNNQGSLELDTTNLFQDLSNDESRGSYGSEWADVDNDGDLDLYEAKCFADATDPNDVRRTNRLYIQQANGSFDEQAGMRGLASGSQSWTGHFFDFDNDGDQDVLVTNHDKTAELYRNDGSGFFHEVTNSSGLRISGNVIQSLAYDFNMDGLNDIVIGGSNDYLYQQTSNGKFTKRENQMGLYTITSIAVGDLNNDHKYDAFATVGHLINLPSNMRDRLLLNKNRESHFHVVYLKGEESNMDGIGAVIKLYVGTEVITKQVKAGESYGVQNTYKHIFGLGSNPLKVDSISVVWPSGNYQIVANPEVDSYSMFWEGITVIEQNKIFTPTNYEICSDDRVLLQGPSNFDTIVWNEMDTTQEFWVDGPGYYTLEVSRNGKYLKIPGVNITMDKLPTAEYIFLSDDTVMCNGGSVNVLLDIDSSLMYLWNDGSNEIERSFDSSGTYSVHLIGKCINSDLPPFNVQVFDPKFHILRNDTVIESGDALLIAEPVEGRTLWYESAKDTSAIWIGDSLVFQDIDHDTTLYVRPEMRYQFEMIRFGKQKVEAKKPYHSDLLNGTMIFDVLTDIILESVEVFTDFNGKRSILLLDRNLKTVTEVISVLDSGRNVIHFGIELIPSNGPFRLTTEAGQNQETFGHRSPKLMSCDSNIIYPYEIDGVVRLRTSQYGFGVYNYFYNWRARKADVLCTGLLDSVSVIHKFSSKINEGIYGTNLKVYPIPSGGNIDIDVLSDEERPLEVIDLLGCRVPFEVVLKNTTTDHKIHYQLRIEKKGVLLVKVGEWYQTILINK